MKVTIGNSTKNLPDALMVGAAKSGTTTLYHHLSKHEQVFFPKDRKEPFYFSFGGKQPEYRDEDFANKLVWDTNEYLKLYEQAGDQNVLLDGSTSYLYHAERSIANIEQLYGEKAQDLKIIIILRNPVDRAYSHYTYLVRNGVENLPFEEAIKPSIIDYRKEQRWGFDYLNYGAYASQVKAYLEHFKHVKVCLFEDLKDAQVLANELFEFLDLSPIEVAAEMRSNPSGIPTNRTMVNLLLKNSTLKKTVNLLPKGAKRKVLKQRDKVMAKFLVRKRMNPKTREHLEAHFKNDVAALSTLIQRDLTHWLA